MGGRVVRLADQDLRGAVQSRAAKRLHRNVELTVRERGVLDARGRHRAAAAAATEAATEAAAAAAAAAGPARATQAARLGASALVDLGEPKVAEQGSVGVSVSVRVSVSVSVSVSVRVSVIVLLLV